MLGGAAAGGVWLHAMDLRPPRSRPPLLWRRRSGLARRGRSLLRSAALITVLTACRGSQAVGPTPTGTLDPGRVDPAFERDWEAVREAQEQDPAGAAVAQAADRLLARDPPLNLRLAAHQAKAAQGLQRGDYPAALVAASAGLDVASKARAQGIELQAAEQQLAQQLAQARALAEAEAGDPQAALQAIAALPPAMRSPELAAATGRARERLGDRAGAALAYAQWRGAAAEGSAEAALAEARLRDLWSGLDAAALEAAARQDPGTPAAQCLLARAGRTPPEGAPAWVRACQTEGAGVGGGGSRIGLLLPRSGKFAGLADVQLAAAAAAVKVLAGPAAGKVQVVWEDAGSSPAEVKRAAQALVGAGADVLVGPVGPGNVDAAAEITAAAGGRVRLVVPGEGSAQVAGVAPTIEARANALSREVGRLGRSSVVVFAPDNAYGKRAVAALEKSLPKSGVKNLKSFYYLAETTSFAKIVAPALASVRGGAAVIVPDQVGRMELLVRQLVREGVTVDKPRQAGVPVLSTGEGVGPDALGKGHEVLDGIYLAPVAWPTADAAAFAETYEAMEGEPPGDQAWLVWRALARAWSRTDPTPPAAAVLRVESGRLVATEPAVSSSETARP